MSNVPPASVSIIPKKYSFFCCCAAKHDNPSVLVQVSAQNPARDMARLLNFTDMHFNSLTAFFVVQAVKEGHLYQTPIRYVSPQAESILESNELVGLDLATLMPQQDFIKTHSQLIGQFFEQIQKTGKNPSSFIGKGPVHGLRNFTVKLPNGKEKQLNFTLDYTIRKNETTGKMMFFVIARLPTQAELQSAPAQQQMTI